MKQPRWHTESASFDADPACIAAAFWGAINAWEVDGLMLYAMLQKPSPARRMVPFLLTAAALMLTKPHSVGRIQPPEFISMPESSGHGTSLPSRVVRVYVRQAALAPPPATAGQAASAILELQPPWRFPVDHALEQQIRLRPVATLPRHHPITKDPGAGAQTRGVQDAASAGSAAASKAPEPPAMSQEPNPAVKKAWVVLSGKAAEQRFDPLIIRAADQHNIDAALVKAVIMAESGYNPQAVSKKGARGLMQLMPRTAEWLGVEDSFDPEHNINGGVRYLKLLLEQFNGNVKLALAAYNAGSRYVRKYQGIPPFKATRYYVDKVFEYYRDYKKSPHPA